MREPVIFDLFDFKGAVAGKTRKPANRVAFVDPKLKPRKPVACFDVWTFPDESFMALPASEALFVKHRETVAFDVVCFAVRAGSFFDINSSEYETCLMMGLLNVNKTI